MLAYLVVAGTLSVDGLDAARVEVGERVAGVDGQPGAALSSSYFSPVQTLLPRIIVDVGCLRLVLVHVVTHKRREAAHPQTTLLFH